MAHPPYYLLEPVVQGTYAHLATHPSYYAFYGLYVDYIRNHRWFSPREHRAYITHMLTTIQPVVALEPAFRKSLPMRLFSRRERLQLGHPRDIRLAWRGVQDLASALGAPNTKQNALPALPSLKMPQHAALSQTQRHKVCAGRKERTGRKGHKANPFRYHHLG